MERSGAGATSRRCADAPSIRVGAAADQSCQGAGRAGGGAEAARRQAPQEARAPAAARHAAVQDGSTHRWLGALDRDLDLVVTLDDATGAIYSAVLVAEEGTASSFVGLAETIAAHGLFRALYTDRGSHYFYTPRSGGKVDKTRPTQVGRALSQLGITHIPSYSPEARGRMERAFGTLQSRLPPELRLAGIATVEAANRSGRLRKPARSEPTLRRRPASRIGGTPAQVRPFPVIGDAG